MANRDLKVVINDSDGNALTGVTKTATFNSQGYSLDGLEYFGIVLDMGAVSGTSPLLDVNADITLDGGTTWIECCPNAANSENLSPVTTTRVTLAQFSTSDVQTSAYWVNFLPNNNDAQVRFTFTIAGSSPTFLFDNAYLVARRWGKY